MIYLATPYSHPDPSVMEKRFQDAARVAADLMRGGKMLFCPITHTHPIAQYGLPKGFDFWKQYDEEFMSVCDELWVVKMPGWDQSKGIKGEIEFFQKTGKPIKYLDFAVSGTDKDK